MLGDSFYFLARYYVSVLGRLKGDIMTQYRFTLPSSSGNDFLNLSFGVV